MTTADGQEVRNPGSLDGGAASDCRRKLDSKRASAEFGLETPDATSDEGEHKTTPPTVASYRRRFMPLCSVASRRRMEAGKRDRTALSHPSEKSP